MRLHGYGKKSSKTGTEIGTRRYRTVPFSCEQKQYDIIPFCSRVNRKTGQFKPTFRTCLVSTGDTKLVSMITSNVEVEIRPGISPNCTSLILPIVSSF